ncbi:MAG: AAA family ATPase [Actinomycetota bacterium]
MATYDDQVEAGLDPENTRSGAYLGGTSSRGDDQAERQQRPKSPPRHPSATNGSSAVDQADAVGPRATLVAASSISVERPEWIWRDRIPVGGHTLAAGREGVGKTTLILDAAAQLTRGQLDGDRLRFPSHVVYVGTEDARAAVTVPRLIAAGADRSRFHFLSMRSDHFRVAYDLDELERVVAPLGSELGLVVIDPLDAHLGGGVDTNRDKSQVQRAIGDLSELAQRVRCGVVGIGHFGKSAQPDAALKVIGSIGFVSGSRSVLIVGEDPDDPTTRVAGLAKANLVDKHQVPVIRFKLNPKTISEDGVSVDTARVEHLGHADGFDLDRLATAPADREERSALEEATDWLRQRLQENGPTPKRDIADWADARDISSRTLKRAARQLGVIADRDETRQGRPATWRLEGYGPEVMGQTPLAHNPQPSDQGKRPDPGVTGQTLDLGT